VSKAGASVSSRSVLGLAPGLGLARFIPPYKS
jgi:hypothetical protein